MKATCITRCLILVYLLSMLNLMSQAQQTARFVNNWNIGEQVGISFNSGNPQNTPSSIDAYEVSTSFSDGYGNIICYSGNASGLNQQVVFDANHLAMPNGDIYVDGSSSCGLTVVPKPGSCNQYYFFHLKSTVLGWGLHYSMLDMNLAGNGSNTDPLGDIDPVEKDVLIYGDDALAEKIKVVQQANTENYWVLVRSLTVDIFYAFEVTAAGINSVPVVSVISPTAWPTIQNSPLFGWVAIDKNRSTLAEADGFGPAVRLYDFNNTTGELIMTELIDLGDYGVDIPYGIEFSPSGNVLYCNWLQGGASTMVSSFDMNVMPGNVGSTRIDNIISPGPVPEYGGLTKAPDGKIYGSRWGMPELLVISDPENTGNPDILNSGYDPTPGQMNIGMPNLTYYFHPDHYIDELAGLDQVICQGSQVELGYVGYDSIWVNYIWEPQLMISGSNAVTNPTTVILNNDQQYILHLVTACGDTVKTDTVEVMATTLPAPTASNDSTYCIGESLGEMTVVGTDGNFNWYNSPNLLNPIGYQPYQIPQNVIGTSNYYVTETIGNCTTLADTVVITLLALPELTLAETAETCLGSSISLIVSSDENILWSPTNLISISNQSETEFIGTESGFVYVQVTNDFGCQDIDSIYITVNSVPNVDYSANILEGCAPHQVNFMDNSVSAGDNPIIDWQWHFYESNTEVNNQQNPTIEFEGNFSDGSTTDSISVMLVVTNQAGCADTLAVTNQVIIHENPEAFFSLFPRVTNLNDSRIKFTDLSSGAPVIWNWEFGNGNGSTLQDPVFQYEEDGIYTVILTIETADGCVSTITDSVIIKPIFSFYIPNSFTPNNDDVNDSFGGYGIGIADYEMTILNRWGEEIFYSANSAEFWNGTFKGKQVEGATYAYKFTIVDINGETHRYLGAITLIR